MTGETLIVLARHAETAWNAQYRWQGQTDIPLNDAGRAQAAALADRLRGSGLTRAYASDLSRAVETAAIVAAALGIPLVATDGRLRERSFGVFEGLTGDECAARHPDDWSRYLADHGHVPSGGEPGEDVARRMHEAVLELAGAAEGPALFVSHGSAIRHLVSRVTGQPCAPLGNGAMFRLVLRGGRLAV